MIGGVPVTINGFCKGSGMIAPDMATMLGFVFTDAKLPAPVLRKPADGGGDKSFNAITVDGDTSTSDTRAAVRDRAGEAPRRSPSAGDAALADFRAKLDELMLDLALQVVRDGEGAQKLVTIDVSGAVSSKAARRIGLTIGNSPLVKTAIAGGGRELGPHRHGDRQGRREGRPRQAGRSRSAAYRSRRTASMRAGLRRDAGRRAT